MSNYPMDVLKSINVNNLSNACYHVDLVNDLAGHDIKCLDDDYVFEYNKECYFKCSIIIDDVSPFTKGVSNFYNLWLLLSHISCYEPITSEFDNFNLSIIFSYFNTDCIYKVRVENSRLIEQLYCKDSCQEDYKEVELDGNFSSTSQLSKQFSTALGSINLSYWQSSFDFTDKNHADIMIDKHFDCQNAEPSYFEHLSEIITSIFNDVTLITGVYQKNRQQIIIHRGSNRYNDIAEEHDIDLVNFIMMYCDYFAAIHIMGAPLIIDLSRCNDLETINNWIMLSTRFNGQNQILLIVNKSFNKISHQYQNAILPIININ